MTDVVKKSAAEIVELAKQLAKKNSSLKMPTTAAGLAYRVEKENWDYEEVPTQGGKNGLKKIYTLPVYLIEELKKNDLIPQSEIISSPKQLAPAKPHRPYLKTGKHAAGEPVASFMQPMVAGYDDWAEQQNTDSIVPVRYHTNVFGSAGNGYEVLEEVNTEAMWFRRSFFDVLGVPPARCFCTRVKGNSMHPTLTDGGTVLWQMTSRYMSEGIYLFRQVGELRIKRLQQINGFTFRIISDNPNDTLYPITDLDLREMQDYEFEIYGRYLWDCGIKL
jgi:peptidase, S24 (lexA) family